MTERIGYEVGVGRGDEPAPDEGPANDEVRDPLTRMAPAERDPFCGEAKREGDRPEQEADPPHRPSTDQGRQRLSGQPALRDEPTRGRLAKAGPVGRRIPARDEHHRRWIRVGSELLCGAWVVRSAEIDAREGVTDES